MSPWITRPCPPPQAPTVEIDAVKIRGIDSVRVRDSGACAAPHQPVSVCAIEGDMLRRKPSWQDGRRPSWSSTNRLAVGAGDTEKEE